MNQKQKKIQSALYEIVRKIPRGKVTTYGLIAKHLAISPRLVGKYLHQNPDPAHCPCHRVVRSDGQIASGYAFGGPGQQICRLEEEKVTVINCRIVDFDKHLIKPKNIDEICF